MLFSSFVPVVLAGVMHDVITKEEVLPLLSSPCINCLN